MLPARERRVFKYGLLAPDQNAEMASEIMFVAHKYRNAQTGLYRSLREEMRKAILSDKSVAKAMANVSQEKEAVAEARREIDAARAASRQRGETKAMVSKHKEAKQRLTKAYQALSRARSQPSVKVKNKLEALNEERKSRINQSRAESGMGRGGAFPGAFGTYSLVEAAASQAHRKMPLFDGPTPQDPRFVRWTGDSALAVQLHQYGENGHGLTVDEVMTASGDAGRWFYIEVVDGDRKKPHALLHMRVASDERGCARFVRWPMVLHRPLPPGSLITRAAVHRRIRGPREEWSVDITVDVSQRQLNALEVETISRAAAKGTVAISIGWNSCDGGVRAARTIDSEGYAEELILSSAHASKPPGRRQNRASGGGLLSALQKADDLRQIRDRKFNDAREALCVWMRSQSSLPPWLRALTTHREGKLPSQAQAIAFIGAWRSPARLARLARRWRSSRFEGDDNAFSALEQWRYNDHHLWAWEANQRVGAGRRRMDVYRKFAVGLARKYERVVMGDADYAKLARESNELEADVFSGAGRNRKDVSPGLLRETIKQAFLCRGGEVEIVKASSAQCPACGKTNAANRDVTDHVMACVECGFVADLAAASCLNMMTAVGLSEEVQRIVAARKKIAAALASAAE